MKSMNKSQTRTMPPRPSEPPQAARPPQPYRQHQPYPYPYPVPYPAPSAHVQEIPDVPIESMALVEKMMAGLRKASGRGPE